MAGHRSRRAPKGVRCHSRVVAATVETQQKALMRSVAMRRKAHPFDDKSVTCAEPVNDFETLPITIY